MGRIDLLYGTPQDEIYNKLVQLNSECDEILVNYSWEGGLFRTPPHCHTSDKDEIAVDFFTELYYLCEKAGVCPSKLIVAWGNANIEQQYAIWCDRNKPAVKFKKVIYSSVCVNILLECTTPKPEFYEQLRNTKRPKLFTYMCGAMREHRADGLNALYLNNMLDKIEWTWLDQHREPITGKTLHPDLQKLVPKSPDHSTVAINSIEDDPGEGFYEMYKNTYFDLIPETYYYHDKYYYEEYDWWETVDLSEKLWRSILNKRPFIVLGNKHVLRELHKRGFKTFPNIFDESYDTLPDDQRLEFIMDYVPTLTQEFLHENLYSSETQSILEHNLQQALVFRKELVDANIF